MKKAIIPLNEIQRLENLNTYGILDSLPEKAYDDITALAAMVCDTPIALISFIDQDRQWFKSRFGLDVTESPRDVSFCGHAINESEIFVVSDATKDDRFRDNPFVIGPTAVRFYAGAPLISSEGYALGTLCVIDYSHKNLSPEQKGALDALSRQVVTQMELKKTNDLFAQRLEKKAAIMRSAKFSIITTDLHGLIHGFNEEAERILEYHASEVIGKETPELFHEPEEVVKVAEQLSKELKTKINPGFEVFICKASKGSFDERQWTYITKSKKRVQVKLSVTPLHNSKGEIYGYMGIAKDLTSEIELKELIESQRMKLISSAKMASLGEIAAGIAHEINNPPVPVPPGLPATPALPPGLPAPPPVPKLAPP
jgi:PAS domain S-box-containing protein